MAPVQNKFIIIPNLPSAINGDGSNPGGGGGSGPISRPPMTTKQAKKAYQQKNKGPRLSKAERRRQELFEQDRIRRELEKERSQARARAARDRKKEKEDKEKAEKKKRGLPLVEVHPSQDTISRFLRPGAGAGAGAKKEEGEKSEGSLSRNNNDGVERRREGGVVVAVVDHQVGGGEGDSGSGSDSDGSRTLSSGDESEEGPPPKKQRTGTPPPPTSTQKTVSRKCSPKVVRELIQAALDGNVETVNDDVPKSPKQSAAFDDDILQNELVCQQLLSESFGASSSPAREDKAEHGDGNDCQIQDERLASKPPETSSYSHTPPNEALRKQAPATDQSEIPEQQPSQLTASNTVPAEIVMEKPRQHIEPPKAQNPLRNLPAKEVNVRNNITPSRSLTLSAKQTTTPHPVGVNSPNHIFRKPSAAISTSRLSSNRPQATTPMAPPPRPPKFKSPAPTTGNMPTSRPRFISKRPQTSYQSLPSPASAHTGQGYSIPPSSTQQFVISHLDDFFPSPSQEVRELYEEPVASLASENSRTSQDSVAMSSPSIRQVQHPKTSVVPESAPQNCQTDNCGPAYESGQVITRKGQGGTMSITHQSTKAHKDKNPVIKDPVANSPTVDMPFFSSQDFLLSQDWMDLKDDVTLLSQAQNYNGNTPTEATRDQAKLSSISGTANDSTPSCLRDKGTSVKHGDKERKSRQSESSQTWMNRLELLEMGDHSNGALRPASIGYPESISQDKPRSQSLATETPSGAHPNNTGRSRGGISRSTKYLRHNTTDIGATLTSQDRPISQRQQVVPGSSDLPAHRTEPHKPPAPPRPSPKPIFASTNRDFRSKYLIERNKTAAWEGSSARRKVQDAVDQFNREEEEAAEKLLMEFMCEDQEPATAGACAAAESARKAEHRLSDHPSPPPQLGSSDERPGRQTANQLSRSSANSTAKRDAATQRPTSKQGNTPGSRTTGRRPNNSRPGGSYEEMLALLEQSKKTQDEKVKGGEEGKEVAVAVAPPPPLPPPPPPPTASQETDYGDMELDDGLYEFL